MSSWEHTQSAKSLLSLLTSAPWSAESRWVHPNSRGRNTPFITSGVAELVFIAGLFLKGKVEDVHFFTRAGDLVLVHYLGFPADSFENESEIEQLFVKPGLCWLRSLVACLLHISLSLHPFSHLWSPSPTLGRRVRSSSVSAPIWLGCIISVFHYKNTETVTPTAEARVRMARNQHMRDSQHSTDTK